MVQARQCLEEAGFSVVRGVLAITSCHYLQQKGVEAVTDLHRLAVLDLACQAATGPSGWLCADGRGVQYRSVGQMITGVLRAEFNRDAPHATIFKVVGADTVIRIGAKGGVTKGPAVIFNRAGSPLPAGYVSGKIFWVDELPGELSSTFLRQAIQNEDAQQIADMCSPSVVDYLIANRTSLYGVLSRTTGAAGVRNGKQNGKGKGKDLSAPACATSMDRMRVNRSGCQETLLSQTALIHQGSKPSQQVVLIGIAGPSGCGKSTLAAKLAEVLNSPLLPISCDWYNGASPIKEKKDWEKPENHDFKALINDLRRISDVLTSTQASPTALHVGRPNQLKQRNVMACSQAMKLPIMPVIVEGFLLFHDKQLSDMFDVHVWLEADCEECLLRRFNRRGRDNKDFGTFTKFYHTIVWPHYLKYRETQLSNATDAFVLDANGTSDTLVEQMVVHYSDVVSVAAEKESVSGAAGAAVACLEAGFAYAREDKSHPEQCSQVHLRSAEGSQRPSCNQSSKPRRWGR